MCVWVRVSDRDALLRRVRHAPVLRPTFLGPISPSKAKSPIFDSISKGTGFFPPFSIAVPKNVNKPRPGHLGYTFNEIPQRGGAEGAYPPRMGTAARSSRSPGATSRSQGSSPEPSAARRRKDHHRSANILPTPSRNSAPGRPPALPPTPPLAFLSPRSPAVWPSEDTEHLSEVGTLGSYGARQLSVQPSSCFSRGKFVDPR